MMGKPENDEIRFRTEEHEALRMVDKEEMAPSPAPNPSSPPSYPYHDQLINKTDDKRLKLLPTKTLVQQI